MTLREEVMDALKAGRKRKFTIINDSVHNTRLEVFFMDENGKPKRYLSQPFDDGTYQELARQTARKIERLGLSREEVTALVGRLLNPKDLDMSALFVE